MELGYILSKKNPNTYLAKIVWVSLAVLNMCVDNFVTS